MTCSLVCRIDHREVDYLDIRADFPDIFEVFGRQAAAKGDRKMTSSNISL